VTRKVVIVSNTAWNIYNFRRGLIAELQRSGYSVTAVAPPDDYALRIGETGARYVPLAMDNRGANPIKDIRLLIALRRIFAVEQPSCVLTFTVKPNVYGTFAARSLGIPVVSNVTGLGTVFIKSTWVTTVVKGLTRAALRRASTAFFQNEDDFEFCQRAGLVSRGNARLIPGSGIDTKLYSPELDAEHRGGFRFLLMGRLLWDKGVGEYVEAAAKVRSRFPDVEHLLMGFVGVQNRTAVPPNLIEEWGRKGIVKYLPPTADVRPAIRKVDCVVLPSYREGTPRSLLEAAAMGKPVIATDVPGCRQVVEHGQTGFLVRPRDVVDLAEKMERMVTLSAAERMAMGLKGREKMVREFDERIVVDRYLQAIRQAERHSPA
jgi:glycosyltransferase involved in cell wall biosynthesis